MLKSRFKSKKSKKSEKLRSMIHVFTNNISIFFHEMYTLTEIEMVEPKFLFLNLCYDLYSAPMILHNKP